MTALFFALISYLGWGTGDIFGTVASRRLGGYSVSFWAYLLSALIFLPLVPFKATDLQALTGELLLIILGISVLGTIGTISFNEGLRVGNASLVGTIAAAYPAVTVIASMIFLNESVSAKQSLAILVIFLGLALSIVNLRQITKERFRKDPGIPLAIITMFMWGIWLAFLKIPIQKIGWFWPGYAVFLYFPLIFFLMRWRKIKLSRPNFKNALWALIPAVVLLRVAEFSYSYAISLGANVAVIAPISGSYPTLFVVLAFLVFKDPITRQQIAGIITTLAGIVLLSIFSV